ncbi:hypothetical protein CHCC20333_0190 [Bacillus paralicheniformis]|nr:hypothetical protein CHCC20333_0190 [Bacillus paralicheniformis]
MLLKKMKKEKISSSSTIFLFLLHQSITVYHSSKYFSRKILKTFKKCMICKGKYSRTAAGKLMPAGRTLI